MSLEKKLLYNSDYLDSIALHYSEGDSVDTMAFDITYGLIEEIERVKYLNLEELKLLYEAADLLEFSKKELKGRSFELSGLTKYNGGGGEIYKVSYSSEGLKFIKGGWDYTEAGTDTVPDSEVYPGPLVKDILNGESILFHDCDEDKLKEFKDGFIGSKEFSIYVCH